MSKRSSEAVKCRIALIGAGRMGQLRAPILYANPRIEFRFVVEPAESLGEALAEKYGLQRYNDLDGLLASNRGYVDAVCISTPTFSHRPLIELAASNGLHIFTEKPIGEDASDIEWCFDVCRRHGVKLCCGFQRRFDASYVGLQQAVQRGDVGTPSMIHVFFADHPPPPLEFLKQGGDPFMDLSVHDVDFVRWVLGGDLPEEVFGTGSSTTAELREIGVFDNATLYVKFAGGAVCNIMMSRGSSYGYDQRCTVYGDKGIVSIESTAKTSVKLGTKAGFLTDTLQHSFPQCFRAAFEAEIETFASVLLDGCEWPIGESDCTTAQQIASCGRLSCKLGRPVRFSEIATRAVTVRPLGNGVFANYIFRLLREDRECSSLFNVLSPYSPSSLLQWPGDILHDSAVDAVYVCSPDAMHCEQAVACLAAGKHVLVEKPVYNFKSDLMSAYHLAADTSEGRPPALMVGFQRRFDKEFIRLKKEVGEKLLSNSRISSIVIESRDPVPADKDILFVLKNSVCHDVDMVQFMLSSLPAGSATVVFDSATVDEDTSAINLFGRIGIADSITGDPNYSIDLKILYSKLHPSYVQRVIVDGAVYGYDYSPAEGTPFCSIYRDAYLAQWRYFARQTSVVTRESTEEELSRLDGYTVSFANLECAETLIKTMHNKL